MMTVKHGFSIDVEDWFQVENLSGAIPRSTWNSRDSRVENNVYILLETLERYSTKATWFMLGWVARKFPKMVQDIAEAGHEIASHGEDHLSLHHHSPESFRESVSGLRVFLEDISGQPVCGYRAPNFTIERKTRWALQVLAESGYTYDSSVFPSNRKKYASMVAPLVPHKLHLPNKMSITEIPPSVLVFRNRCIPIAGGSYFRLYPYPVTRAAVRHLEKEGRSYFFYVHPWEIDEYQPRINNVSFLKKNLHYYNLGSNLRKIRRLLKDFSFTTFGALASDVTEYKSSRLFRKLSD